MYAFMFLVNHVSMLDVFVNCSLLQILFSKIFSIHLPLFDWLLSADFLLRSV